MLKRYLLEEGAKSGIGLGKDWMDISGQGDRAPYGANNWVIEQLQLKHT